MSDAVLDASAVLAVLHNERGAERVRAALPGALLSTVNLGEVISKLVERGMPADIALDAVLALSPEIVPLSQKQAVVAGALRTDTRKAGLSFGDRCCLALAIERMLPALTGDAAWTRAGTTADVELFR